jgi:DNA (cytosine-5)-methyltransferase 1
MSRRRAQRSPQRTFIDLFAGCGGLSLGFMRAGWRGLFAVERDPRAFETLRANLIQGHPPHRFDWPTWLPTQPYEIGDFNSFFWRRMREMRGSVDLLAAGPPCQGFSFAGLRKKGDPRNRLFERFFATVKMVQPKYLLLENVSGINVPLGAKAYEANGSRGRPPKAYSHKIRDQLYNRLGYKVVGREIRADEAGVAQWRPRFFIIGVRQDLEPEIDPFEMIEEVRPAFLASKGLRVGETVTVGEAISDLETQGKRREDYPDPPWGFERIVYQGPETAYQRLLHDKMNGATPNGLRLPNHREATVERFRQIIETCRPGVSLSKEDKQRLGGIKKHTLVLLDRNAPSHTLTTLPDDYVHYCEPRVLTVREMARLQSFPDWWEFRGKYTTGGPSRTHEAPRYSQVGNAVAPFVAEIIGLGMARLADHLG